MSAILVVFAILYSLSLFFVRRIHKVVLLLIYQWCLTAITIPFQFWGFFLLCLCLSEVKYAKQYVRLPREVIGLWLWMLAGLLVWFFTSPHAKTMVPFFWNGNFVGKYLLFIFSATILLHERSKSAAKETVQKTVWWASVVVFLIALSETVMQYKWFVVLVYQAKSEVSQMILDRYSMDASELTRFRVGATFFNSFCYGWLCIVTLFYALSQHFSRKFYMWSLVAMSVFGIVVCFSRTVLLTSVVGMVAFVFLRYRIRRSMAYAAIAIVGMGIALQLLPQLAEMQARIASMFQYESSEDYSGSSIEMREFQWLAVLRHIEGHEWFGNGYQFFNIDLGWSDHDLVDPDLQGMESVIYGLLLERGIIGCIFYYLFWIGFIMYIWRYHKTHCVAVSASLSLILSYLCPRHGRTRQCAAYDDGIISHPSTSFSLSNQ